MIFRNTWTLIISGIFCFLLSLLFCVFVGLCICCLREQHNCERGIHWHPKDRDCYKFPKDIFRTYESPF